MQSVMQSVMLEANRLLTCGEMTEIDLAAQEELGIPGPVLMENAGRALWEAVADLRSLPDVADRSKAILFCAGPGNNGGDALVVARWACLEATHRIQVITTRRELGRDAAAQWAILERIGLERLIWESDRDECIEAVAAAGLLVDGIAGTGLSGPLRAGPAQLVEMIRRSAALVVAIDLPSGARDSFRQGDPIIKATVTVVTGYRKRCLYTAAVRPWAGEIRQVDPGFPPLLVRRVVERETIRSGGLPRLAAVETLSARELPPPITPESHKGTRGRVGVIGGAPGTGGAPLLAGLAALRGGAGMVRVCHGGSDGSGRLPDSDPSLMVVADEPTAREALAEWADVLVVGPGWTDAEEGDLLQVLKAAHRRGTPVVADAHALRLLRRDGAGTVRAYLRDAAGEAGNTGAGNAWAAPPLVLTPHPGELAAIAGVDAGEIASDPWSVLEELARDIPALVVLKGAVTILRDRSGETVVVDGRCPSLGTAGSGDVLAGLMGAMCARPMPPLAAARAAVLLHLRAGRDLATRRGWFTATDLAEAIGVQERIVREGLS